MNNVAPVALRAASNCLHSQSCLFPARIFSPFAALPPLSLLRQLVDNRRPEPTALQVGFQFRAFSKSTRQHFHQSTAFQLLKEYGSDGKPERGLKFQETEIGSKHLIQIFGRNAPPKQLANHLLRLLHARRVDGTLDIDLPPDVDLKLVNYPKAVDKGLAWLRKEYPIDEDAAILARIEREEDPRVKDNPSELVQRGQDLGLYRGPQSGYYHAELSDKEGDVHGRSELDRIRAENKAEAEREERELQEQIEAEQAKFKERQVTALAQRPDQGLETAKEMRPPNEFEKWVLKAQNRATSKLTEDSPEIAQRSTMSRLLPSFLFASLLTAGCYLMAQYWVRPKQAERLWPNLSLAWATIAGIVSINVGIYLLWKMPSAWRFLNKYFITVPGYPYAFSILGSTFSHQQFSHLAMNMIPLVIFGLPLHEEIGRGNFLAIYLASGVIAGFAGLARYSLQRVFITTTLGASGCLFGILTTYLTLHADDKFTIMFLPEKLAEYVNLKGGILLAGLAAFQVAGAFRAPNKIAYVDHLFGMVVGFGSALWLKKQEEERRASLKGSKRSFTDMILGRKP